MARAFEVRWSGDLPGTPDQAWEAITARTGGWLWPISYEPRVGGAESGMNGNGGTVTAWAPGKHFAVVSAEGDNKLDWWLDGSRLEFRQVGEFADDEYAVQLDACRQHTDFYYHTLCEYLGHFAGREASFAQFDAPEGVTWAAVAGALGGELPFDGVIDYRTPLFVGVRCDDALYRFFGRDAWGWPVGMSLHLFEPGADAGQAAKKWSTWLEGVR